MLNQGLAGLVLQLLEGGRTDVDRQELGLGFQTAGVFSDNVKHNLTHAGESALWWLHCWPAEAIGQVRRDTGNRPWEHLSWPSQLSQLC
jgi:hypothetical protein